MSNFPAGILLAAGNSRRFGSNKLLYPVAGDTPMVRVTAKQLLAVLPRVVIVVNRELLPYADQFTQTGMHVVVNERAGCGIGSSIACGVGASADATGWLIALADMPWIRPQTIKQLSQRLRHGAGIVAPLYKQQRGHPVGFNRSFRDELAALDGDVGARHIIQKYKERLELLQTSDAGVITDIDRESDTKKKKPAWMPDIER